MSARRLLTAAATTSLVAASLALAVPAHADPSFAPTTTDVVGTGSDTSMYVMTDLAAAYNGTNPAARLATWDAVIKDGAGTQTNSAQINLVAGAAAINRPNGSTAGKGLLHGAGNDVNADFARSSSPLSPAEKSAGLQAFPFARDTLALATAKTSNAPATISPADMVKIYSGTYTSWSQVPGGGAGAIEPKIPQTGSGTRDFFIAQLRAANGGNPVTLAPTVQEVQEHDATPIQSNPNAVAPFSLGRNRVAGSPLRIEGGFVAERAIYNVVRGADVSKPEITALFGASGFLCSVTAKPIIHNAGFDQLLPQSQGGVCGVPTQDPTTNLATEQKATTTTVAGTSASAGTATLTATVGSVGATPDGLVTFFVDGSATPAGTPVPLTGGKATKSLSGLAAGAHTVVARFQPTSNSVYTGSQSAPAAFSVVAATPAPPAKAATKLKEKFKGSYKAGSTVKSKLLVKESAAGAASGKVVVKRGSKVVGKGTVKNGVVVLKLKGLKKGKNKLKATYAGDAAFLGAKLAFTITLT